MEALCDLRGVFCITDDVIVHGTTREHHDRNLRQFLQRDSVEIKLNKAKLELCKSEITLPAKGNDSFDPEKITAILVMKSSTNTQKAKKIRRFDNISGKNSA